MVLYKLSGFGPKSPNGITVVKFTDRKGLGSKKCFSRTLTWPAQTMSFEN